MSGKVVVSVVSIILVVGVIAGVVAVVHITRNNKGNGNITASKKMVESLCAAATYKETCNLGLGSVAKNDKPSSSQDYMKGGLKMAMDEMGKGDGLADSLKAKAKDTKNATRTEAAISQCKHWFDLGMDRLNGTFSAFSNSGPEIFKEDTLIWEIRLLLTDVLTFAGTCADELDEAEAGDIANAIREGIKTGRELTTSMLDILTVYKNVLAETDGSLDPNKLQEALAKYAAGGSEEGGSGRRRLLAVPIDEEGYPSWLSAGHRRLLGKGKEKKDKGKDNGGNGNGGGNGGSNGPMIQWDKANVPVPPPVPAGTRPTPNAVVAQDGSGQFKSIMEALKTHPGPNLKGHFVVYVKAGTYKEQVLVSRTQPNVYMYGDGPTKTIVTGSKNFGIMKVGTSETAPFNVEGHNFFCKDMGFQNTAGPPGHQAVALRVNGFHAVFQNCRFDAFQDTLYTQGGAHFFRDCEILGTIDFIFGNGATLIQNSKIIVRKPGDGQNTNVLTAQGRDQAHENAALVLQGCTISAEPGLLAIKDKVKNYLGRPWKQYANTIFMENELGDFIAPEGYEEWQGKNFHQTCFYGEYNNRGPGANTANRVKWPGVKVLKKPEAEKYSAMPFLKGAEWVKNTGAPITMGLAT